MTIFVDASALVAVIMQEDGHRDLASRISNDASPIWSPVARWETVRALVRIMEASVEHAETITDLYASEFLTLVSIGEAEARLAVEAHRLYGKGNHPARLNMGDCFAYACAKANDARLLYKGDDFAKTDLA